MMDADVTFPARFEQDGIPCSCVARMSFKTFYAKNQQRYRQLYPFLKQSQLRIKIKQLWERNNCSRSSFSVPNPVEDVSVKGKVAMKTPRKVHK